ncbi:hypothetical protein GALMADRAFT_227102 [Galerina marginata CBS 339.88]|uniref:Uncharacterized protein n=1 Tax=Galerina marginata (strain CBS 339.88) TaxID=685588 RepID=A0A067SUP1_GALM3|nr:hypothetical protein GALMADRAFT_227102 [Galerina marginata CBS 339.88]
MSTTTTTMPMPPRPHKHTPVPLLLESFPIPPTHIPPTPTTPNSLVIVNPPLSGPPSTPLPPVPGPSRISEHEQLLLLSSAVNRSRRSSKYSVTSSSQRESVISLSSAGGHGGASTSSRTSIASSGKSPVGGTSPLPPLTPTRPESRSSYTSPRSPSSSSSGTGRPSISISGTSPPPLQPQLLTRLSISPFPLSDIDDDDDDGEIPPAAMPSPTRSAPVRRFVRRHQMNESISSIDMRDILGLDTLPDEEEDEHPGKLELELAQSTKSTTHGVPPSTRHQHQMSLADPIDPHTTGINSRFRDEDRPPAAPMHRSNSSIGSFSYPSSSKRSPIPALAPFVPASPSLAFNSTRLPPLTPPLVGADAYAPPAAPALPHSASTLTQFSSSSLTSSPLSSLAESADDEASASAEASTESAEPTAAAATSISSPTVKDIRLELRAERTRSAGLKRVLNVRSRSRSRAAETERPPEPAVGLPPVPVVLPGEHEERENEEEREKEIVGLGLGLPPEELGKVLGGIVVTKTTTTEVVEVVGKREMTLDELGPGPFKGSSSAASTITERKTSSRGVAFPAKAKTEKKEEKREKKKEEEDPRAPSPDIATILSTTPRPALTKSTSSRPKSKSRTRTRSRVNSASSSSGGAAPPAAGVGATIGVGVGVGVGIGNPTRPKAGKRRVSDGLPPRSRFSSASASASACAEDANGRRRVSEGTSASSWHGHGVERQPTWEHTRARARVRSFEEEGEEYDAELERVLEGEGSEDEDVQYALRGRRGNARDQEEEGEGDSDSSLDLHTPLPHLMVRDGLLSPNSKLLPGGASRSATPLDGRPGSTLSVASHASLMTKSGIIKDERDTPMRRVRHRDGKMLRGGIGLTTGLGWSDSEDEDAPSPLTRRLSSLNLARRSSASSVMTPGRPSHPQRHPLSRSYSSGALLESEREYRSFDTYDEYDDEEEEDHALQQSGEWAQAQRQRLPSGSGGAGGAGKLPRASLPPTSWQRRTPSGASQKRSSGGTRTSTSSVGSAFSLDVTSPHDGGEGRTPSRMRKPSARSSGGGGGRDSTGSSVDQHGHSSSKTTSAANTPSSTASTLSIPMPSTPKDTEQHLLSSSSTTPIAGSKFRSEYNKDKTLPPLPPGGLKKMPSHPRMDPTTTTGIAGSKIAFPRARTFSSTSSASASTQSHGVPSSASPAVRPLQLPRQAARAGDRAAVPVPSVLSLSLSSSTSRGSLRTPSLSSASAGLSPRPSSPLPSPSSPPPPSPGLGLGGVGIARPKPRTGTGMVYHTSTSKMRPPMTLSPSASVLGGGSAATAVGSIGRAGAAQRAILL